MIDKNLPPRLVRLKSALVRYRVNDIGASAVEFAILAPFFLGIVFVTIMVGVIYMAKSELDAATQAAARAVMTGQATTSAQLQSTLCANVGGIFNCANLMTNLNSYSSLGSLNTTTPTLTFAGNGSVSNAFGANFGNVGNIMVLQVMYQMPVVAGQLFNFSNLSNGNLLLVSTAVFVNE